MTIGIAKSAVGTRTAARELGPLLRAISFVGALLLLFPAPAIALEPVYTSFLSDLAIGGHDAVAYFTQAKPVEGSEQFETEWKGATWRFSSAENRTLFQATPERYAPQYGGYCAWAMAQGYDASGDPRYWKIVDGRLYLNYDASVQKKWEVDIPGFIQKADLNWPKLLAD
jgi:YHS domain-containing protein